MDLPDPAYDIINHWKEYKRDYPWRSYYDPYKIMVAEFMLQRTRADQVVPIYEAFLDQYPDVFSLSEADDDEVSDFTSHLGLHKRGRNFKMAAAFVVNEFGGTFPDQREDLLKIPGVGDYVAGAILTACFNRREYVIDSNIARFINRYWGFELSGEIRRKKKVVDKSKTIFSCEGTRELLFAILDFTALICKPQSPDCKHCALNSRCSFFQK